MSYRLSGLLLAALVVSACATLTPEERAAMERGTPMLAGLLGTAMPDLPARAAVAVAMADAALQSGRTVRAQRLLGLAEELLAPDAPVCAQRGVLQYLRGLVAQYAGGSSADHGWSDLRETCLEADVSGPDVPYQIFFGYLTTPGDSTAAKTDDGGAPSGEALSRLPDELWRQQLRTAAPALPSGQGQILLAYADWLELATATPVDRCDTGFGERHLQQQKRAAAALEAAGRADLALGYFNSAVLTAVGQIREEGVAELEAWANQPRYLWLRPGAIGGALATLRFGAESLSPLVTSGLCEIYYADALEQVSRDQDEGFNARNVTRLVTAFNASGACLGRQELGALVDACFQGALADGEGRMGVLHVVGGVIYNLALQLLDSRSATAWSGLAHLFPAMDRVQRQLGDTPEDQALGATLKVVAGLPAALQGTPETLVETMAAAADVYDELLAQPVPADGPELLRLLPALRLANLAARAALMAVVDEPEAARPVMKRLRLTLPQDLAALFVYFHEPDQSARVIAIIDGALAALAAYDQSTPDEAAVLAALRSMGPADLEEAGWWAVGLDVMRMVAWDGLALLVVDDDPGSPLFKQALGEAEAAATRVVGSFLKEVDVPDTLSSIVRLLPALHGAVPAFMDEKLTTEAVAVQIARVLEGPLAAVVAGIEHEGGGAGDSQVAALLNELLVVVARVGLEKLVREPEMALAAAVETLERRVGNYPPDVRVFMELLAAVGRFYGDPQSAAEAFARVADEARTALPKVGFVPVLMEASLRLSDEAPIDELIKLVNRALAYGLTATRCGQAHAVHSLLPARMWLHEASGDHAGAKEDYEAFVRLVAGGFEGDVMVSCQLRSYAESFIFSMDIANSTASFLLPGKNEGTFNVGLGAETGRAGQPSGDELVCEALYTGVPRHDRIMEAHLAFGAYELLNDNPRGAHFALLRAIAVGRQMVHATAATLGRRAAGAQQGATKVSLEMIAYTALLARLHGQGQTADTLDELGYSLAMRRDGGFYGVAPEHEVPVFYRRVPALRGFGELVAGWFAVHIEKEAQAYLKVLKSYQKKHAAFPSWYLEMVTESFKEKLPSTARGVFPGELASPRGSGELARQLFAWRNLILAASRTGVLPSYEAVEVPARELVKQGLYGEMLGPMLRMVIHAWQRKDPELAFRLLELVLAIVPPEEAPVPYLDAMLLAADLLIEIDSREKASEALVKSAMSMGGYHSERDEIQLLYRLLQLAGPMGDGELVWNVVGRLAPMVQASSGTDTLAYYTLVALEVGFRLMAGQPVSEAAIRRLDAHGQSIVDGEGTRHYFQLLLQSDDARVRENVSEQFLVYVLQNGPSPELPAENPVTE